MCRERQVLGVLGVLRLELLQRLHLQAESFVLLRDRERVYRRGRSLRRAVVVRVILL